MSDVRQLKSRIAKITSKYVVVNESGDGVAQAMIMAEDIHKYTAEILNEIHCYVARYAFNLSESEQLEELSDTLSAIGASPGSKWMTQLETHKQAYARKKVSEITGRRAVDKTEGPRATNIDHLGDTPFQGKRIVFHGYYQYHRTQNTKSITIRGGKVDPRVTKKTDFLITNNKLTGQPYKLAVKYGIPIIGTSQFAEIIKKTKPIIF
jgi:NAD-dependent DNA ligase